MGLFDKILHDNESFIKNFEVLDFSFMPKKILYREREQNEIAYAIKPLFNNVSGSNLLIHGVQGIGKTIACKRVLEELEEYDEIESVIINCWQNNTEFKVLSDIADKLNLINAGNKVEELQKKIISKLNKSSVVIILDEVDKLNDFDIIYTLLEKINKKSIILITNYKDIFTKIDPRIGSRLNLKFLEFRPYNSNEIRGILKERLNFAFYDSKTLKEDAFDEIVNYTTLTSDIRKGLILIKESSLLAEKKSKRIIEIKDVKEIIGNLVNQNVNSGSDLSDDESLILEIINNHNEDLKIGDLFDLYKEKGGSKSYKSIQRIVDKLFKGKFIDVNIIATKEGRSSVISKKKI